jgi:hypothetical protein
VYETKLLHQHLFGVSASRKKSFISRLPILLPAFAHPVVLCVTDNTTAENIIADKILRLKKLTSTGSKSPLSHNTYNYANLQQELFVPSNRVTS